MTERFNELGQKPSIRSTPLLRLLRENRAKRGVAAEDGYLFGSSGFDGHIADPRRDGRYIPLGSQGYRGLSRLEFFADATITAVIPYSIWGIEQLRDFRVLDESSASEQYRARTLITGTLTIGGKTGSSGDPVPSTNRYAESVTMFTSPLATHITATYGHSWQLLSPASNGIAGLSWLDVGDLWGLFVDWDLASTSIANVVSVNSLYSLST